MNPDIVIPLAGMGVGALFIWTLGRVVLRLLGGGEGAPPKELAAIDRRLSALQEAVDTMAVEVERISEGQRFTTKLLSERGTASADRAPDA
jgi:hypothetical protein